LGLFCIKRSICREFSTDVEAIVRIAYRVLRISNSHVVIRGSLVNLDNLGKLAYKVASFVRRMRSWFFCKSEILSTKS